ncbi:MAG: hypothetical protein Q7R73_05515 [bacterium]|nr:hypothetical protein [bacterium]
MFSLFKKQKKETGDSIAFDLSVDSLRVAVFRRDEGGSVRLVKKIVKDLPGRDHVEGVAKLLVKEIREFIFHSVKESHQVPLCVKIGFPSDLLINTIETFSVERSAEKKGKRISEEEVMRMFHDAVAESRTHDGDYAIIKSTPLSVTINGYEIDIHKEWPSPVGEHIAIRAFLAKMPKTTWHFFSELPKMWGGIDFEFFSLQELQASLFSVLLDVRDVTFVDVSALTTEISFMKDGSIEFVASFPFGGRTITHRLSRELKLSFTEAERLKSQLGAMLLPEDLERRARDIIAESLLEWRRTWKERIALDPEIIFPDRIYFSGGGALSFGITSIFEDETIKQELFVSASPVVTVLDAGVFREGRISGEKLLGPGDMSLAALMLSDEKAPNSSARG